MKLYRSFLMALVLSLLLSTLSPALIQPQQVVQAQTGVVPEAVTVLACNGTGSGGDLAFDRGIQFTVSQGFSAVEARFAGDVAGTYSFTAFLRRSSGFVTTPIAQTSATVNLPSTSNSTPYMPVRFNFGNISVSGTETFTVMFTNVRSVGTLYLETFGIGTTPCPNVMETDENNVASPTPRSDPPGFKVLAPDPNTFSLGSTYTSTPPRIDGSLEFGEWNYANRITYDNGFISVVNDGIRLYVLLDVTGDTTNDGFANDYYYLTFDTNRNGVIDANTDINYGSIPTNGNMRYQFYTGPNQWTSVLPSTYSSRGEGFGCFFADGSLRLISVFPFRSACTRHHVWEFAIDLAEINSTAPGSARMGVRSASTSPSFTNEIPAGFTSNFSNLINISLAPPPFVTIAPVKGATVAFDTNPIEITQAVQSRTNAQPLVSGKSAVARVYTLTANSPFAQSAKTYLYGSVGGVDLPGSPMASMGTAPTVINRNTLNNTANFQLPASWNQGTVAFSAKAVDQVGHTAATSTQSLAFTGKQTLTVWIIPINTGTTASPVVPSQSEIDRQKSYLKTIYPLSSVTFVQKPWTEIGVTTVDDTITRLNTYYNTTAFAWLISVIFTGKQPFILPDQIYGFTPSGGGISDPVWIGGAGRVARGFIGTSGEGTMAHEINHNLDRSANGTWGRHVNPNNTGCGAQGPDPSWPFTDANTHEVGFDTRLPWSPSGSTLTVIPATTPDIMSYCQSGLASPTKWISGYRWGNLFGVFPNGAAAALAPQATVTGVPVFYISGTINRSPETGKLQPVLAQVGIPDTNIPPGDYFIDLLTPTGQLLSSTPFKVEFLDDPEEPVNKVNFNFQIPQPAGAAVGKIVLRHGNTVLDQIVASAHAPTVSFVKPAGGETWSGMQTVQWTAADQDGDPLTFTLLYSPDNGSNWYPVATDIKTTSLAVDLSALPGGSAAKFRVIASDGFNNAQADSAAFTTGNNPPLVSITAPDAGGTIPPGGAVQLSGDAQDPEGEILPDEAFAWTEGNTPVGSGREALANLAPGLHTLTLSVADSAGNTGTASVTIFIGIHLYLPTVTR